MGSHVDQSAGAVAKEEPGYPHPSSVRECTISAPEDPAASWPARSLPELTEIQLLRPEGLSASPASSNVPVVPPGATRVYVGGQNAVNQNAVDQNGELHSVAVLAPGGVPFAATPR